MTWFIDDYDEFTIMFDNLWQEFFVPKFRMYMVVDGDDLYIYYHDRERAEGGSQRVLRIDYHDVVTGYSGYLNGASSALQLQESIEAMQVSAWTGITQYTDEQAQDSIGLNVGARLKYNDATGSIYVNWNYMSETASFTLDETYDGALVQLDNAVEVAVTVPAEPHNFEIGAEMMFYVQGAGSHYFVEDTGVHIHSEGHLLGLDGHGAWGILVYLGSDDWHLRGKLTYALDPDAFVFINAHGNMTDNEKIYYNTMVVDLKAASLYSKIIALYPFIGSTAADHKWNAIDPQDTDAAFRLTFSGSPTHASTGVTFNGSSQYADTKCVPNTHMTNDNTGLSSYSRTSASHGASPVDMGCGNGSYLFYVYARDAGDFYNSGAYLYPTNVAFSGSQTDGDGLVTGSRTSSTIHKLYRNGSQIGATDAVGSSGFANLTYSLYIGALNFAGVTSSYSAFECAFAAIHEGFDDTETADFYTIVQAFQTSMGRQV